MAPAHPPLPTARNFPFQPDTGIQISTLIRESALGVNVAGNRQNAGRSASAAAGAPPAAGGANDPAGCDCTDVTVVFGSATDRSASHESGGESVCATAVTGASSSRTTIIMSRGRIVPPRRQHTDGPDRAVRDDCLYFAGAARRNRRPPWASACKSPHDGRRI